MEPAEQDPRIDRYLSGELSAEEARSLEAEAQSSPALQDQLRGQAVLRAALRQQGEATLRARWDSLPLDSTPVRPIWQDRRVWLAAASAVVLAVLGLGYFFSRTPDPQALYAAYYAPLPLSNLRGETPHQDWTSAQQAYIAGDYAQAYRDLKALSPDSLSPRLRVRRTLYLGIAAMEQARFEEARAFLDEVPDDNINRDYADWYRALSWLGEGKVLQAHTAFATLADRPGFFRQEQARKLAEQLAGL